MTTKNMEARREAFEAWVSGRKVVTQYKASLRVNANGHYADYRINDRWLSWNAAIDSLCIKLPLSVKRAFDEYELGYNEALDHCQEALTAAGVPYK